MQRAMVAPPLRQFVSHRSVLSSLVFAEFSRQLSQRPDAHDCSNCRFWEALDERGGHGAGLCRHYALGPTRDAWPITENADWCADWAGKTSADRVPPNAGVEHPAELAGQA